MCALVENGQALAEHLPAFGLLDPSSEEVRSQRAGYTRERRVLRFVAINAFVEPLHAACDMRRFIIGMAEDVVGGHDADACHQHKR